jgi:lysophospholipase L1-like esterase
MLKINSIRLIKSIVITFFVIAMLFCFGCNKEEVEEPTNAIVFLGDSITSSYDLITHFPDHNIINSGVWGDRTDQAHERLESDVIAYNPAKVFILLGINDVGYGRTNEDITSRIEAIINEIQKECSKTKVYLISVYPMNVVDFPTTHPILSGDINDVVNELNEMLKELANDLKVEYLDIAQYLKNETGELKKEYTVEGLHLTNKAYEVISEVLLIHLD